MIEREYRKKGKDKLNAYSNGKTGTDGGMRAILDIIMEHLKEESIERHIRDVIDRYIAPSDFEEQVEIISEIISAMENLPSYIDPARPERYARNYEELIRGIAENMRRTYSIFRRL